MTYDKQKELYQQAAEKAGIELKGKTMPYTSANGHMFSQLNKDGQIGIRFSKEIQEKLLKELKTTTFKSYGAELKGYVLMPATICKDTKKLTIYLKEGLKFVMSLDPK